ncbi:hypothetical protein CHS0354_001318 [Potamilus streckersoni]|uniref:Uncharacterized protein n=1 Tax=Potamilus streckersoni TaxID=2493646 RepID=A0AAE0VKM1_9BIVA|nr:hypothetical protein CHS0354_001318 [Potamilus streckersoni]
MFACGVNHRCTLNCVSTKRSFVLIFIITRASPLTLRTSKSYLDLNLCEERFEDLPESVCMRKSLKTSKAIKTKREKERKVLVGNFSKCHVRMVFTEAALPSDFPSLLIALHPKEILNTQDEMRHHPERSRRCISIKPDIKMDQDAIEISPMMSTSTVLRVAWINL